MSAVQFINPYEGLPHVNVVKPFSEKEDQAFFDEVYEVMKRHDKIKRFGLTLLHHHFDIKDGETLLESCDEDNRTLTLQPVEKNKLSKGSSLLETNWRFDNDQTLLCIQYCDGEISHELLHLTAGNQDS